MISPRMAGCLSCLLMCCGATVALANGLIRDGVGAISIGRGGTNIAFADNTAILLDNPAGMVNMSDSSMFQISLDGLLTNLHYQDPFTADASASRPMGLPEVGFMRRSEDGVWAWGVALTLPAGFGAQFELTDPVFGARNYSSFGALAKALPGVACQVTERLSVGATLGVGFSYVNLDGPLYVQTGLLQGAPVAVDVVGAGTALVWSLGAQYRVSDRTTLGVTYQSESRFHLAGNARVDILAPVALTSGFDSELDLTWPSTVGIGAVHQLTERQRISSDVIWVGWSKAFDSMGLHLTNPDNPIVPILAGPAITDQFPFNWRDSVSCRFGYEFFVTPQSVLRAGYVYNLNQVPSGTLTPYVPATLEHGVSVGLGRTWGSFSVDMAYQYAFGPRRFVQTSDLVGGDFSNSIFEAEAHWGSVTLTRRF